MIDKISVMAADIDGTLCMKGGIPGERTLNAIRRLHEEGVLSASLPEDRWTEESLILPIHGISVSRLILRSE